MNQQTPLHPLHVREGARMMNFAGWDMPVNYGSQIEEHHAVRVNAGMFDVSHMTAVDLRGPQVREFLRYLLANDVAKLTTPGKAMYSCMLNPQGGVIDDLITYRMSDEWFRTVVNAGTSDKDLAWMREQSARFKVEINPRHKLSIIAVQGPHAREKAASLLIDGQARNKVMALKPFEAIDLGFAFVARTGYTGEDGFEIILDAKSAQDIWQLLLNEGVRPCGLGARDTLRLEAGLCLYGQDMNESTTPLESGLGWTIAWEPEDRDFIGRAALLQARAQNNRQMVGLLLEGQGVLRAHQPVRCTAGEGEVTSGTFSPTLKRSIALARVPKACGEQVEVNVRDKWVVARVVKYPFVRNGQILVPSPSMGEG
jgi:aminomethyltransferase